MAYSVREARRAIGRRVNQTKPKVSVCVITYNQEKYIRQCLQSIVDQETDFELEVIVGDDCSTDGTRLIVQEFADQYPDLVRPIFHEENQGGTSNLLEVYDAAKGEYIAHMDGDDYMLPGKLRTQAEALDSNSDCTICVHDVRQFDQQKQRFLSLPRRQTPRKADLKFLLMNLPYFAHSSKMYRAECREGLERASEDILDCYFHVHHALNGDILYLDEQLGVYRVNAGPNTNANDDPKTIYRNPSPRLIELGIEAIEYARRSGLDAAVIDKAIAKLYFEYSHTCLLARNFDGFKANIKKSVDADRLHGLQAMFNFFSSVPALLFLMVRSWSELKHTY